MLLDQHTKISNSGRHASHMSSHITVLVISDTHIGHAPVDYCKLKIRSNKQIQDSGIIQGEPNIELEPGSATLINMATSMRAGRHAALIGKKQEESKKTDVTERSLLVLKSMKFSAYKNAWQFWPY